MALPILAGVMIGSQVLGGIMGLVQQHQMNKQNKQALEMMQRLQQQQNAMLSQFMGGTMPGGYPQMGQQMG